MDGKVSEGCVKGEKKESEAAALKRGAKLWAERSGERSDDKNKSKTEGSGGEA
ncbi:hypothetical protein E2C01_058608 [Portunus trituberculatus]|uniref:Uncharacterized protein n=1 Tax=Portunus trituberculatus TaxID=210409 RepID=A0A5B7GW10_PORTR|nr:hypothetical protein [Portunus trituberculatus]